MQFTELEELYEHLETNAGDYKYNHNIADLFQNLRDLKHEAGQRKEAKKAQWEVDCFRFTTDDGRLASNHSGIDGNGLPYEYPSLKNLTDNQLDYIEKRLAATSNPIMEARYSHILWDSSRKHNKHAKTAVDSYLLLVKFFEEREKELPEKNLGFRVLKSIENASYIAFKCKHRIDDVRSEMSRLVKEFNPESNWLFALTIGLIRHMLEGKSRFPKECYEGFPGIVFGLGKKNFDTGEFHNSIDLFKVGEQVNKKLGLDSHDWYRAIAESYVGLMDQREDLDPATSTFCQDAIHFYKKVRNDKKVKELEKRYEELKGQLRFGTIKTELDLTEYVLYCKEIVGEMIKKSSDEIVGLLITDKGLIPSQKAIEERLVKGSKRLSFTDKFPVAVSDHFGHTTEHFISDSEILYFHLLRQYAQELEIVSRYCINEIFIGAIRNGKLNFNLLLNFFIKYSWYGKNLPKKEPQKESSTYNWLSIIAPSLNEYFEQIKAHLISPQYNPNFVLAIDSLTLKIEGLVRDICRFSGVPTFYQKRDKNNLNIAREKDINQLLREKSVKELFDEDDLLLFRFVLVEKAGLNLRHRIAHCLLDYSGYSFSHMNLLLLILMKLGRYDFVNAKETTEGS